jgi:hypothetical protein
VATIYPSDIEVAGLGGESSGELETLIALRDSEGNAAARVHRAGRLFVVGYIHGGIIGERIQLA